MSVDVDGISIRLHEIRKVLGYSQQKLSDKVLISRSYIARVEQGLVPSSEFIIKLTNSLNISVDWLLTGRGNMYLIDTEHYLNKLDADSIKLLSALNNMPNDKKSEVIHSILNLLGLRNELK